MRVALRVAYDGTVFYGFQRQPDVRTVEGDIVQVLEKLNVIEDAGSAHFKGASRTDKGVSAFFNVVSFDVSRRLDLVRPEVLNHHLRDIWVLGVAEVPCEFHPRFWAKSKTYRYYLIDEGLDLKAMKECAGMFVGTYNFKAFARLEPGKNPVRKLTRVDVTGRRGYILIEIEGESFLWEMARRIVNALRFCGLGLMDAREIQEMLTGDYTKKVPAAAPEGLILWHIAYEGLKFRGNEMGLKKAKRDLFERYSRALTRAALFGDILVNL